MVDTKKSLYRLPKQGKIFGVCAGLADFFDMDVTLMRVIFVVLAFVSAGAMVLLYIILAIILPVSYAVDGQETAYSKASISGEDMGEKVGQLGHELNDKRVVYGARNYFGLGLVILGIWLLLVQFVPQLFDFRWDFVWPTLLIFAGLLIILRRGYGK